MVGFFIGGPFNLDGESDDMDLYNTIVDESEGWESWFTEEDLDWPPNRLTHIRLQEIYDEMDNGQRNDLNMSDNQSIDHDYDVHSFELDLDIEPDDDPDWNPEAARGRSHDHDSMTVHDTDSEYEEDIVTCQSAPIRPETDDDDDSLLDYVTYPRDDSELPRPMSSNN